MWSWWTFIHISWSYRSSTASNLHKFIDFFRSRDIDFSKILDINTFLFIRTNFKVSFMAIHQVSQLLHIELDNGDLDTKLDIFRTFGYWFKNLSNHPRDNSRILCYFFSNLAFHSECFPWRSLSIGKYCSIKSLNDTFDDRFSSVGVNFLLGAIRVKYSVKWESRILLIALIDFVLLNNNSFII